MKKTNTHVTLTASEIRYVYTCWEQCFKDAYKNFSDYLDVAVRGKEISGSVYY